MQDILNNYDLINKNHINYTNLYIWKVKAPKIN